MPTPGYVFRDGGDTPAEEKPDPEFRQPNTQAPKPPAVTANAPLAQNTTTSHQLATGATGDHEVQGAVQRAGWQANAVGVDNLVGGLPNDELWTLIRRFNKASILGCECFESSPVETNTY
ncbi:hypothetical protein Z517_07215 [Fonsecaea pedrosoi CBS 271.37]|uniref:Uncharacterized protein n=1 Tax=Fonsecaea pedrosoi CBS 271.37 TaxID=1442368 RepID=A0A0D2H7J0_9EURO|nr:uncharacterized protein Z517_07215 [Fonsecaea pedrosoi CBS 271.37]KIW80599.1 hypothetical protein Z517_07215 [Fonsecaea pedrosoi CBS 271.37]